MDEIKTAHLVIVACIGFSGLIISAFNVFRLSRLLDNDSKGRLYHQNNEIRKIFFERPELRKYFFENADISKGHDNYNTVLSLAEMVLNYLEHLELQKSNCSSKDWGEWEGLFHLYCRNSPVVRELVSMQDVDRTIRISKKLQNRLSNYVSIYENATTN